MSSFIERFVSNERRVSISTLMRLPETYKLRWSENIAGCLFKARKRLALNSVFGTLIISFRRMISFGFLTSCNCDGDLLI